MMKPKDRGQASIEFMTVLGITLLIFIMLGLYVYQNYVKSADLKTYIYGQRLSNHIADSLNTINTVSDGHSSSFSVPERLEGSRRYTINFYGDESSVFVEGSSLASGRPLVYSSPITSVNIRCMIPECDSICNKSSDHICIQVNNTFDIRLSRHAGAIYMMPKYNVLQGENMFFAVPYYGEGHMDADVEPPMAYEAADSQRRWNIIYIYRNLEDESTTLAISANLTNDERIIIDIKRLMGDVVQTSGVDLLASPEIHLKHSGDWEVKGAKIRFAGGFMACLDPYPYMTSQDWTFMVRGGPHIKLERGEEICIGYP